MADEWLTWYRKKLQEKPGYYCAVCGNRHEPQLHAHHVVPNYMGGTDKDGRIVLCDEHHRKVHAFIDETKLTRIDVWQRTKKWLEERE